MTPLDQALKTIREARDNPNLPVSSKWNDSYSLMPYQRVAVSHLLTKKRFVLGDPCLVEGSLVETKDGLKPIERITSEDILITPDGEASCKGIIQHPETEVIQIILESGVKIVATPNHVLLASKICSSKDWEKVEDLQVGDSIYRFISNTQNPVDPFAVHLAALSYMFIKKYITYDPKIHQRNISYNFRKEVSSSLQPYPCNYIEYNEKTDLYTIDVNLFKKYFDIETLKPTRAFYQKHKSFQKTYVEFLLLYNTCYVKYPELHSTLLEISSFCGIDLVSNNFNLSIRGRGKLNPSYKHYNTVIEKIKSIEVLPNKVPVYDINTSSTETYLSAGVLHHNCGCHRIGQGILLYNGDIKKVEDIEVGDQLMGPDSNPRNVLSLCRGNQNMVRIIPNKGDSFVVNEDHILTLVLEGDHSHPLEINKEPYIDVSVKEWKKWTKAKKSLYKLFKVPVEFKEKQDLPIDPHILGILLGDGNLRGCVGIISTEQSLLNLADKLAKKFQVNKAPHLSTGKTSETRLTSNGTLDELREILQDLGLLNTDSGTRFIPNIYKKGSRSNRLKLLAGLMDTDDHLDSGNQGYFDLITKSERLANDVKFVALSLGIMATVEPFKKAIKSTGFEGDYFRICLQGEPLCEIQTLLGRKQSSSLKINKNALRYKFTTEDIEPEDYYGFTLDGDGRYLLEDFTVTHNTGKTPTALYTWAVLSERNPLRLMVLTTKSATYQWGEEIEKFLKGVEYYIVPSVDHRGNNAKKEDRYHVYREWINSQNSSVLIMNWNQFMNDWEWLKTTTDSWADHTQICLDEGQKIKNPESKLHQTVQEVLKLVPRVHVLTATLVKNRAQDACAIINAVIPGFMSVDYFKAKYCNYETREIYRRGKVIKAPQLKGYQNLEDFSTEIEPYYLTRTDEELGIQRPEIVHITRRIDFNSTHRSIYIEAEKGMFIGDGSRDIREVTGAAMVHAQLAANSPEIFMARSAGLDPEKDPHVCDPYRKYNSKLETVLDLLENELQGEKVVIYSTLETTVSQLEIALAKYKPSRITGVENDEQRANSRRAFVEGDSQVMLLTDAGGEALNLQVSHHLVFFNRPYDPGRYVQLVGRVRRFGLKHDHVVLWHLSMMDSIDEFVDATITEKFGAYDIIVKSRAGMMPDGEALPLDVVKRARYRRLRE